MKYKVNKSYLITFSFSLVGVLALISLHLSSLSAYLIPPLYLLVVGITFREIRHAGLVMTPEAISELVIDSKGVAIWCNREKGEGDGIRCQVLRQLVLPGLVILKLQETVGGSSHTLLLVRDMLGHAPFRRLKRQLLTTKAPGVI